MTRTALRTCCTAGLLLTLGCRGAPPTFTLPGGEVPSSHLVRRAAVPAPDEPPLIAPVVYKKRKKAPAPVRLAFESEQSGPSPLSVPPALTRRLDPEPPPPPRRMPPLAAAPKPDPVLGCGANHRWLVGPLHHDAAKDRWTVRYADPGAGDPFGGELELLRAEPMRGFFSGQTVRVEGFLVDPEPLQTQPAYRVRSIQLVYRGE
jgi:hypothetical protein